MKQDLGMSDAAYGLGVGLFYIGYLVLEIPGAIIAERWNAQLWIVRIMVTWGLVSSAFCLIQSVEQFYLLRVLLGVAEAGFFPAMLVLMSRWFGAEFRAKSIGILITAAPLSALLVAPLSSWLLTWDYFGWRGWRWMLLLQGLPTVFVGIACLWLLPNRPSQARWLTPEEATLLEKHTDSGPAGTHGLLHTLKQIGQPVILKLCLIQFFNNMAMVGCTFWSPLVIKQVEHMTPDQAALWSAIAPGLSLIMIVLGGWSSDRTQERFWHTLGFVGSCFAMLVLSAIFLALDNDVLSLGSLFVGYAAAYTASPLIWALAYQRCGGAVFAAGIGAINMVGNTSGLIGTFLFGELKEMTGQISWGLIALAVAQLCGLAVILSLRKTSLKP
ncbi:MAG: MFS transporter [Chthoniobacterales bacterium]|nr:MFS transporter [Chthoniobacterales bacterium]